MNGEDSWWEIDMQVTHYCGGSAEKSNKPKGTQTEITKWFNPIEVDTETGVIKCRACGAIREKDHAST